MIENIVLIVVIVIILYMIINKDNLPKFFKERVQKSNDCDCMTTQELIKYRNNLISEINKSSKH